MRMTLDAMRMTLDESTLDATRAHCILLPITVHDTRFTTGLTIAH